MHYDVVKVFVFLIFGIIFLTNIGFFSESFAREKENNFSNLNFQNIAQIEKNDLLLTIKSDKTTYVEGEPVKVNWIIENVGDNTIEFMKRSTCHDGIDYSFTNSSNEELVAMMPSYILLIPENDPNLKKFDPPAFYGKILSMLENQNQNQTHAVIIITGDPEGLQKILEEQYKVTKSHVSTRLGFVTAKLTLSQIPEIAKNKLVSRISDGELGVCGTAILRGQLEPNQTINGSFSWSQMILKRDNQGERFFERVADGLYYVNIRLDDYEIYQPLIENKLEINLVQTIPDGKFNHTLKNDDWFNGQNSTMNTKSNKLEIDVISNSNKIGELSGSISQEKAIKDGKTMTPKKQIENGILPDEVDCKEGFEKIFKVDNSPACVKPESISKLIERGWAKNG